MEVEASQRMRLIEQLSQALLREYMHRKGYKSTLRTYDTEEPRLADTIDSRSKMSAMLHLKAGDSEFTTFMEMLIEARFSTIEAEALRLEKRKPKGPKQGEEKSKSKHKLKPKERKPEKDGNKEVEASEEVVQKPVKHFFPDKGIRQGRTSNFITKPTVPNAASEKLKTTGESLDERNATTVFASKAIASHREEFDQTPGEAVELHMGSSKQSMSPMQKSKKNFLDKKSAFSLDQCEEFLSDAENDASPPPLISAAHAHSSGVAGVGVARAVKKVLCGNRAWWPSWIEHGFYFSGEVPYGLVQRNGGPCGVLASLNAFFLRELFLSFEPHSQSSIHRC